MAGAVDQRNMVCKLLQMFIRSSLHVFVFLLHLLLTWVEDATARREMVLADGVQWNHWIFLMRRRDILQNMIIFLILICVQILPDHKHSSHNTKNQHK